MPKSKRTFLGIIFDIFNENLASNLEHEKKEPIRSDYSYDVNDKLQYGRDYENWLIRRRTITDDVVAIGTITLPILMVWITIGYWLYPLPIFLITIAAFINYHVMEFITAGLTGYTRYIIHLGLAAILTFIAARFIIRLELKLASFFIYYWVRHFYRLISLAVIIFYIPYYFQIEGQSPKMVSIWVIILAVLIAHFILISRKNKYYS